MPRRFDVSSCSQGQLKDAEKQVSHLSSELAKAAKAYEKLETETDLNSKKSSKALDEIKRHLATAQKEAEESKSALSEVSAACCML